MEKSFIKKFILFLFMWLSCFLILKAQDDKTKSGDVGDEQVTVVKAYQPTLSDAIKISDVPQKDTAVFNSPDLKYNIEPKKLDTKYNITPIKPVKIKDENIKKLYNGFVKAGYGNYNTPYGEVFYNAMRSKEFNAGVHFKHLSSRGKIKGYGFPGFSENNFEIFGNKFMESSILNGNVGFDREVAHYYGYFDPPDLHSKSETKHLFKTFWGDFSIASSHNDKDRIDYKAGIAFYNFTDNREQLETDFEIKGMGGKHFENGHYAKADLIIDISKSEYKYDLCPPGVECFTGGTVPVSTNRTIVRLNPRYELTYENMKISAGANMAIENGYDDTHYHFYPVAEIKYPLIKEDFTVFGEISGNLRKNSLRSLNNENHFLVPSPITNVNELVNTNEKFTVKGGLIAKPDRQVQVTAYAGFSRLVDDVFYINSFFDTSITSFNPVYYDNSQFNIHAEVQYIQGEKSGITFKTDYFSYNLPDSMKPWFKPSILLTLGGNYNIADKIFAKAELYYTGSRTAPRIDGTTTTLKSYIDLNLGVDYKYSKVLSVFLNVNNLTASRYFKWYNYPSYRLNVLGGVTYSF
ncbi:MAG TPA: TonB-dependent receptor [Bacteroidia bacterium]|nr:TonB-dependent receptor [Bacteroidia bacterium]